MAVNIASLTVKAAEVRAPRGRGCGCGMCGAIGECGIRCWAAAVACLQARKDALSGRRRRRQTILYLHGPLLFRDWRRWGREGEWSQHCAAYIVHTVHTSVCSSISLHTYAGMCLAPRPQLDTKDTFISWSRVRRELVLLEKKLADAGTLRCPFTHSPAPHYGPLFPWFLLAIAHACAGLCTSNSTHARPHALYAVSVPVSL